jgi:hypothetical protein
MRLWFLLFEGPLFHPASLYTILIEDVLLFQHARTGKRNASENNEKFLIIKCAPLGIYSIVSCPCCADPCPLNRTPHVIFI